MRKALISLTVILFSTLALGQNLPNIDTGTKGQLPVSRLKAGTSGTQCLFTDSIIVFWSSCASGTGTVTDLSVGNLNPLFTSSVATSTTTPSVTFTLSNASAHTFFGNTSGSTGAPSFSGITAADLPGVFAQAKTNVIHKWLNSYDSTTGLFTQTQVDYSDLSGLPQLAVTKSAATSNWIRSYDSTTGLFTASQPAYSDLTGTPVLPANTTATSFQFFTAYNSGTGAFTKAAILAGDVPTLNQSTSGNAATATALDHTPTLCSAGNYPLGILASGAATGCTAAAGGGGTVTSVSSGNLSPLFTVSVATATTTPAISFTASNFAAHTFFGNNTAGSAVPSAQAIGNGDLPGSGAITLNTTSPLGGGGSISLGNSLTFTCTGCLTSVTAHNLLSATHGDTTAHSVVRGDLVAGIGAAPTWTAVAKGGTNTYPKWNASGDVIPSTLAAAGIGTPAACSNQFVTGFTLNADAVATSTCTSATLASAQFANQGTTTTLLHGNAAGNPSFSGVSLTADATANQGAVNQVLHGNAAGQPSFSAVTSADTTGTFTATAHNLLSATHGDTTTAAAIRGDGMFAIGVTPTWQRLAHPATTGGYFKWNGTDIVASSLAASGTGTCGANQFETTDNADAAPTCAQPAYAGISGTPAVPTGTGFSHVTAGGLDSASKLVNLTASTDVAANQGTTTTLLHGNAAGQASFASVVSGDLNITTTTCTNQYVSAISSGGVGTCTTDVLASAQHANQGTTVTVLHGNASGNPSFASVTSADTTGTFPPTAHAILSTSHSDATVGAAARGDIITGQGASPTWTRLAKGTASQCLQMDGSAVDITWGSCGAGGGVSSVSGTANQITSTGGTTPILALANPLIFPGEATYAAATTGAASTNTPSGTAPTTPAAGDYWRDGNGFNFIESTTANGTVDVRSDQAGVIGGANTVRYTADSNVAKTSVNAGALEFNNLSASALTANQIVLGNGSGETKALGSLGTSTTILHGNAAGVPSFASVVPGTDCPNCVDKTASNNYPAGTAQDFDTARASYWGQAPIIDVAEVGTGTDMGDKLNSVYSLAAYTSANCAILDLRGFVGAQADATVDALNNATRCTKWILNPSLRLSLTKFWTIQTPATANQVAAPSAPTLATSTTGGSLAATTTYGVKVILSNALLGSGEGSLPSTEATKLTGAGATNSITVTSPAASGDATCYYVYSATPVGSGWKLNNTSGCIPIGTSYVIQTVGAGIVPPTNAALFNGMYELDCNGATISLDSTQATIQFKTATPVYMHDCRIESTQTSSVVNATSIQIAEAANGSTHNANVLIDNVSILGGGMGIVGSAGTGTTGAVLNNIRIRNFRYGSPTMPTARGIYITGNGTAGSYASNINIENVDILPSIWPTTSFYSAGIMLNPCVDCSVERVRCTNIDGTQSAFDSCVAVIGNNIAGTGSKNVNVSNVICDNLTQVNCIDVNGFATNVNVDKVLCQNINTIVGITGTASPQADCVDIYQAARVNISNVICQNLSPGINLPPCMELYESSDISVANSQFTDSSGGMAIFGAPSTHLTNIVASRNWRSGIQISDHVAQVTCNTTTAVVWVSGNPFGPWTKGTQLTIAGTPFQVDSVTDSTHMTLLTPCSAGTNQPQIVPTADISLINPKLDDNGKNGTGAARTAPGQEGLYASGSTQITIIGGSANDNQPTASKSQQYGIRFENSARGRVIGIDTTNNVGGTSCGFEYGANVAGNHGICDSPKKSAVQIDDNATNQWTVSSQQTLGPDNKFGQASIIADTGTINTTETIIVKTPALSANRLLAGTVIRVQFIGTNTSTVANTSTFTLRMGTAGTTSDTAIFTSVMAASATTGTNVAFSGEVICTVRTVGASGTGFCSVQLVNPNATSVGTASTGISVIPLQLVLPSMSTFNTTTAGNILSLSYKSAATTTTSIFKEAFIEIPFN